MQGESGGGARERIVEAALPHVAFDGWSDVTLRAAARDSGVDWALARALFPRGGVDLALAFHQDGDRAMAAALAARDLGALRYRERVTLAVRLRLETIPDAEPVRRGASLFALPQHAGDGARAVWGTADAIWRALGDSSTDLNWYTKRATLSAVYAATVLYWLGDDSPGHAATWEFLDRRIENVMAVEKLKAGLRNNPISKALMSGPLKGFGKVRMPQTADDLPGGRGR